MKKIITSIMLLVGCVTLFSFVNKPIAPELSIGSSTPLADLKMKDVSGKDVSLNSAKGKKGLLVIFSCNTCPYVKLSEQRIKQYTDYAVKNNIGCVIVNSNEAQRNEEDSFEAMIDYAKNQQFVCSYVVDQNSMLADAFGANRTPQCFLFNTKVLVYKGAIDDNVKDASVVKNYYLRDAMDAVIKNTTPVLQETKSIGCTIKRNE